MSPCEACRQHRHRWAQHAGVIERAWLAASPVIVIALLIADRVC